MNEHPGCSRELLNVQVSTFGTVSVNCKTKDQYQVDLFNDNDQMLPIVSRTKKKVVVIAASKEKVVPTVPRAKVSTSGVRRRETRRVRKCISFDVTGRCSDLMSGL